MTRLAVVRGAVRGAGAASSLALTPLAALALATSCAPPPPPSAAINLELSGLSVAIATLSVDDDDGDPAVFDVTDFAGGVHRADGTVDIGCADDDAGVVCSANLVLDPGSYRFTLAIAERDRCGASATTLSLSSGDAPIAVDRGGVTDIRLQIARADFDDDGDGIVNALERAVCGRFDVADDALPPQDCVDGDACCASSSSPLQGQRAVFAGGTHTNELGEVVDVAPFALDATELTWRAFSRCVAAGACLFGQPEHPARQRLDDPALDDNAPVTGLLPSEAAALCAWHGGRLPDDDEWDFAAADRAGGPRGVYPFDVPDNVDVEAGGIACREGDGVIAANHAAREQSCPEEPVAVGSYPSTFVTRGVGSPLADLAGNAAEWTVRRGATAAGAGGSSASTAAASGFPDGVVEVDVRGGSAGGIVELLENDLVLRVTTATTNADGRLRGLAATTGVRCAFDVGSVDDVAAAAVAIDEPACGAKP
jgi:formylglycine-generating enzyme required for sulfatase activity